MISVIRMCDRVQAALKRRRDAIIRRDLRIGVLEQRVKRLAGRIGTLNERLGAARLAEKARKAELRELRRLQMRLPL